MTIKVYKANEVKANPTMNMLVYGPPGIGKTTFGATAPNPLFINLELGTMSIADQDIDVVDATTAAEAKEAINYAVENNYKTVVIDSLGRYSELLIEKIVSDDKKLKPLIQHWGDLNAEIKKMIWFLQKKQINTVFICLEAESEEDGIKRKRPMLSGKLTQQVSGIVDCVGYLYSTEDRTRLVSINPTDRWYAKHRTIKSNRIIEDLEPDFQSIHKRLQGNA